MDLRQKTKTPQLEVDENLAHLSSKTIRMKRYRDKMKLERPQIYNELKMKDKQRKREDRIQEKKKRENSNKKLQEDRQKWKEQKKKYRQKKKDIELKETKNTEAKRQIQNDRKKKAQKQTRLITKSKKKTAVLRTQSWRMKIKLKSPKQDAKSQTETTEQFDNPEFTSRSTEHRAYIKAKQSLPITPRRKSRIIEKLIDSPRTRGHLENKGVIMTKNAKKKLHMGEAVMKSVKNKISKVKQRGTTPNDKRHAYQNLVQSLLDKTVTRYHKFGTAISSYLKVRKVTKSSQSRPEWWKPIKRKTRKDKLSEDVRKSIKDFYLSPSISRENPSRKEVLNENGDLVQRHIMNMTLSEAFDRFKTENPDIKVGFSSFKKEKPKQVKIVNEISHRSCLCQVCCNLALKIDSLKKHAEDTKNVQLIDKLKDVNKTHVSNMTLCQFDSQPKARCLKRECTDCGPTKFTEYLHEDVEDKQNISWFKWECIQVNDDKTQAVKKVTSCVQKVTAMTDFIADLENDLQRYPSHIFRSNWQHKQLQICLDGLKENQLLMLMDFSENYRCRFQNEATNAYFDQQQVTVHPFMCYYLQKQEEPSEDENNNIEEPSEDENNNIEAKLVKHPIVVISNDTRHDAFAVKKYEEAALDIVKKEFEITEIIKFSDGCAAQYKGKNSFGHLSQEEIKTSRNYFETSHGKSPCDGLGAVIKSACFRAVKANKAVIGTALSAFEYCKKTLEHEPKMIKKGNEQFISKRNIIYVDKEDIQREELNVKTLTGTRLVHSARNKGRQFELEVRNLSCFCSNCVQDKTPCQNSQWVDQWSIRKINSARIQEEEEAQDLPNQADSVDNSDDCDYEADQFVGVFLETTNRKKHMYIAKVLEVDGQDIRLRYLKQIRGPIYTWSTDDDIYWHCSTDIIQKFSRPELAQGRGLGLRFCPEEISVCMNKISKM